MSNKKGNNTTTGIKTLIATASLAAMMGLWSIFASQDQVSQVVAANGQNQLQSAAVQNSALNVGTLPTIVPLQLPNGEVLTVEQAQQELRAVSAPAVTRSTGSNPVIVSNSSRGQSSGGASSNQVTTTTKSS